MARENISAMRKNESQTESYRMLGLHTVQMCAGWNRTGGLSGMIDHVRDSYLGGGGH